MTTNTNAAPVQSFAPVTIHIGAYRIAHLNFAPDKVSIIDTRTGEGGCFDANAVTTALNDALDTFFVENY